MLLVLVPLADPDLLGDGGPASKGIAILDDANDGMVLFAAQALGRIGDPRATDPLKQRLTKGRPDLWVRKAVREALADIDARVKPAIAPQPAR